MNNLELRKMLQLVNSVDKLSLAMI
jgi:hypothetical protein